MATLPMADLEDRRIYHIQSRNLIVGVWHAENNGFIGIRRKFDREFLFEEYHWETGPPFGTAWAIEDLGVTAPAEIDLSQHPENSDLFELLKPYQAEISARLQEEDERERQERESRRWAPMTRKESEREERKQAARAWFRAEREKGELPWRELIKGFEGRLREALRVPDGLPCERPFDHPSGE